MPSDPRRDPRRRQSLASFLPFVVSGLLMSALPLSAAITAQVDGRHLRISGTTASADVVVVAAIRETSRTHPPSMERVAKILVADAAGNADLDYGRDIPVASIWAVVDRAGGASAVITAADYPRREKPFAGTILKNATPADAIDQLTTSGLIQQMLLVRPGNGGGSWFVIASDGASNDEDHAPNGQMQTSTTLFDSLEGREKGPKKLKAGDILILIDPFEMTFTSTVVAK